MSVAKATMRVGVAAARSRSATLAVLPNRVGGGAVAITGRRSMTSFEERERGEEAVYMRREDKKLLQKLLEKEKAAATSDGVRAELMEILGSNTLPSDVVEKLVEWKKA